MFCFGASGMLLTLYLLLDYVMIVLEVMIGIVASCSVGMIIEEIIYHKGIKPHLRSTDRIKSFNLPIFGKVTWIELISNIGGVLLAVSWYISKNWILNNVIGLCLATTFLKSLRLNQVLPGILLLSLLLFYDIFWVFGSKRFTNGGESVMMAVASGLDVPIKLIMPRILLHDFPTNSCSILGLGDIVIPGLYIGFLIRFGRYIDERSVNVGKAKIYQWVALISYFIALLCCGASLMMFK